MYWHFGEQWILEWEFKLVLAGGDVACVGLLVAHDDFLNFSVSYVVFCIKIWRNQFDIDASLKTFLGAVATFLFMNKDNMYIA